MMDGQDNHRWAAKRVAALLLSLALAGPGVYSLAAGVGGIPPTDAVAAAVAPSPTSEADPTRIPHQCHRRA